MAELILVADDDPDILRFVELNLRLEGYDVDTAGDGEEALQKAQERIPSMVVLDVMMPRLDGLQVCESLRSDSRTSQIPVIMLTARSMSADKVLGLTAGADDYISKPFDPLELVARVKTTLRRTREMRSASPLTGLPGNIQIESEIYRRFISGETFGVLWLDLDNFKGFNDRYGFMRGDGAIRYMAKILQEVTGPVRGGFLGHVGGDDFVVLAPAHLVEPLCEAITRQFDANIRDLYDPEDAERGHIVVVDRQGRERKLPPVSVSIGAATNEGRELEDHRELVEAATEMKTFAKKRPGSVYAVDRRGRAGGDGVAPASS